LTLVPTLVLEAPRMTATWIAWWWVKQCLIRLTRSSRFRHLVVYVEDCEPRSVVAVPLLILALHDRERLHYVVDRCTRVRKALFQPTQFIVRLRLRFDPIPVNISGEEQVELTRFRGHLNVRYGGVHDGKNNDPVHAGV